MRNLNSITAPPTPLQRAMIADDVARPGRGFNIDQIVLELPPAVSTEGLADRWLRVCARHDALRMGVRWDERGPQLCVQEIQEYPVQQVRFDSEADFEAWLERDRRAGFESHRAPLHRAALAQVQGGAPRLIWTLHHLIVDGRSFADVLREVLIAPEAGAAPAFAEYARRLAEQDTTPAEIGWRARLAGVSGGTRLSFPGYAQEAAEGPAARSIPLEPELRATLAMRAREWDVSLFTFAQAAWALVLSRCASTDDVLFGSVVSDRRRFGESFVRTVGNFAGVVPSRVRIDGAMGIKDWLRTLRAAWLEQRAWVPLDAERYAACAGLAPAEFMSDTLLLYERQRWDNTIRQWGGPWASIRSRLLERAPVPFSVIWIDQGESSELLAEYERDRIPERAAADLLRYFCHALAQLAETRGDERVDRLEIANASEVGSWSFAAGEYTPMPAISVDAWILKALSADPDQPCVREGDRVITRGALLERSAAVAAALLANGARRGDVIPVWASRGADYYAAILGALRAGFAFMPLEAERGDARIGEMARDAGCRIGLVATSEPPPTGTSVRWLDAATLPPAASEIRSDAAANDPAYVMFTSGSTGVPKGVVITRGNLAHYVDAIDAVYRTRPGDILLQFSSIQFDASIEEIFLALARGLTLVARPPGPAPEPEKLCDLIEATGATIVDFPTAYWAEWTRALARGARAFPASVRLVAIGGEEARADDYRLFRAWAGSGVRWINTYGPTECTVAVTAYEATGDEPGAMPIGRPLQRTTARLVDHRLRPLPPGAIGQLAIGGAGVGPGYLNRAEETAARFVRNPNPAASDAVWYLTGDRAWFRADGTLVFAGRADEQVKIRGFRVEPGEASAVLRAHPRVRDAAVIAVRQSGSYALAAFWTGAADLAESDLRAYAAARLPDYLRPTLWRRVDVLPLTPNGKLDVSALRRLASETSAAIPRSPPRDAREETVARIWRQLFGISEVGREDNFFALGGHSLMALRFLSALRGEGWRVNAADLFRDASLPSVARSLVPLGGAEDGGAANRSARRIRTGSDRRIPLVLAPSDFGDLLVYSNFIERIGAERPCIGLDCSWLADDARGIDSMERLVSLLADELEDEIGETTPALLGYCFGGYVAMELARAWRSRGRSVAWLGLIDARPHGLMLTPHYVFMHLRAAFSATGADWIRYLRTRSRRWLDACRRDRRARQTPGALSPRERVQWIMYHRITAGYRSPRYDGELHFFYPEGSRFDLYGDPTGGWLDWADRVRVHKTPGMHTDMMKPPHVNVLAERVEASIRAAERAIKGAGQR